MSCSNTVTHPGQRVAVLFTKAEPEWDENPKELISVTFPRKGKQNRDFRCDLHRLQTRQLTILLVGTKARKKNILVRKGSLGNTVDVRSVKRFDRGQLIEIILSNYSCLFTTLYEDISTV